MSGLILPAGAGHVYISTGCLHGEHDFCRSETRRSDGGVKNPARCKFCATVCLCPTCQHPGAELPARRARAFHRGYPAAGGKRARQVTRLHILREPEDHPPPPVRERASRYPLRPQGWCGTSAAAHTLSPPVFLDPMPATPPAGLSWCPPCIGQLAALTGMIDGVAALLAARGTGA